MGQEPAGGFRSLVRREGERVVQSPVPSYGLELLRFLESRGWRYAPVVIAATPAETTLSYLAGEAAAERREAVAADRPLAEVSCHNDLDPCNTIYGRDADDWHPGGIVDWDAARPGDRVHDLAHLCWTFSCLGETHVVETVRHRVAVLLDAYGWAGTRREVVDAML